MLEFKDVSLFFDNKKVLENFSFTAKENVCTTVLGPSGGGKTTILRLAAGLTKPTTGMVTPFNYIKASFLFQEDRLLPWSTALENITALGVSKERAEKYLALLGLAGEEKALPHELSGGMKRRVAIARTLAYGGDLFFLDEPLQGLDVKTAGEIQSILKEELMGKTVFMITHSPAEAFALAQRLVIIRPNPLTVINDKDIGEFSSPEEIAKLLL